MMRLRKLIAFGTAVYSHSCVNDKNSPIALTIVVNESELN